MWAAALSLGLSLVCRAEGAGAPTVLDKKGWMLLPPFRVTAAYAQKKPSGMAAITAAAKVRRDGEVVLIAMGERLQREPPSARVKTQLVRSEWSAGRQPEEREVSSAAQARDVDTADVHAHERPIGSAMQISGTYSSRYDSSAPREAPCRIELVIARYKEDLVWLNDLVNRTDFCVTVYNKGGPPLTIPEGFRATRVIGLANVWFGREGHTYLVHIISSYNALAEWTVFLQGNPQDHNPKIVEFLRSYSFGSELQLRLGVPPPELECLTCQWNRDVPSSGGCTEKVEPRTFGIDPKTVQVVRPVAFHDQGVADFMNLESERNRVPQDRLLADFCDSVGLPQPNGVMDFCFGAEFIVHRVRIRQRPRLLYEHIYAHMMFSPLHLPVDENCTECLAHRWTAYLLERLWFYVFEGDTRSGKVTRAGD